MSTLNMILLKLLLLIIYLEKLCALKYNEENKNVFERNCVSLVEKPCFADEKVIGIIWTVYYTWNMGPDSCCVDLVMERATPAIKKRYKLLLDKYFLKTIDWSKATLIQKLNSTDIFGYEELETLMIPVKMVNGDSIGLFQSISKLAPNKRVSKTVTPLPEATTALKLLNEDRYLVLADCQAGNIAFLVRKDLQYTWNEIDEAIAELHFEDSLGYPACYYKDVKDRSKQ